MIIIVTLAVRPRQRRPSSNSVLATRSLWASLAFMIEFTLVCASAASLRLGRHHGSRNITVLHVTWPSLFKLQNKSTLRGLGEEISGNGILTIGKWEFAILQNGMVSYTCKDSFCSPEYLAYWSRWLEVMLWTCIRFLAVCSSGREVPLGRNCKFCKLWIFIKLEF